MSEVGKHPRDWRRDRSKPRVIRKVVKKDAKGRAKIARDGKTQIDMERVTARTDKPCESRECPMPGGLIQPKTEYVKVIDHMNGPLGPFIKNKRIVQPRNYHFDCVPSLARPLVRFLVPCNWLMLMCDRDTRAPLTRRWFTGPTPWVAWLDKNHPYLTRDGFHVQTNKVEQFGTNDYWSALYHEPRFQKH